MTTEKRQIRCAIYTRKSTEEGLDQEFNSLDAQRMAAENFIASQVSEGWVCLPEHYDDGGFTGGNTDRPAVQRLLAAVKEGLVDCVVVYKVDRLSRSLLDFARLMSTFEEHKTAFVSVTQQFNTSTSMGRLMLNVLLSFAQFEREVISERTRDKIHMTRMQGKWSGGHPSLGYEPVPGGGRIIINQAEADQVRAMFKLYLEGGGLLPLLEELDRRGWTNKTWVTRDGTLHQGCPFRKNTLYAILTNPIYMGKVRHNGKLYPGEHEAIIDPELYAQVQRKLAANRRVGGRDRENIRGEALLQGIMRCKTCDCGMVSSHSTRENRRYRYYLCHNAQSRGWKKCPHPSLPAADIERFVINEVRAIGQDPELVRAVIAQSIQRHDEDGAELAARMRLLEQETARCNRDLQTLVPVVTQPGTVVKMTAIQEHMGQIEKERGQMAAAMAALQNAVLDEAEIVEACRRFDPLWDTLTNREQARLLRLLIERVEYDHAEGAISITFHPNGIKALNGEADAQPEEVAS